MASLSELRERRKRGEDARKSVKERAASGYQRPSYQPATSSFDAIRNRSAEMSTVAKQKTAKQEAERNDYTSKIDTTYLTIQPKHQTFVSTMSNPPQHGATADQQKLGMVKAPSNGFQAQPQVNEAFKPSNPGVTAFTTHTNNPINALYQQIQGNPNGPTSELPSTGSKRLDQAAHFVGETAGQILQNPVGGTEQTIAKGLEFGAAKLLPKVAPAIRNVATHAATGAIENAAAGAGIGQTNMRQIGENAAVGAAFGGGGSAIAAGIGAAKRKVADVAEDMVRKSLGDQRAIGEVGETGLRADAGKRILADIDEQLDSVSKGNSPNKTDQYRALLNDRNETVDYIKQHEPEFEAPKPRIRESGVQPIVLHPEVPKPLQVGDEVIPTSADGTHLSAPKKIVDVHTHVDGTKYYQLEGENAFRPEQNVAIPESAAQAPVGTKGMSVEPGAPSKSPSGGISAVRKARQAAKRQAPQQGVRGFHQTAEASDTISPEVTAGLQSSKSRNYKQTTNAGQIARANRAIEKDADKVEAKFSGRSRRFSADEVVEGILSVQNLQKSGNFERAVTVAENISKSLTRAGQEIQAASVLDNISPEGALIRATRKVERINDTLPKSAERIKITPKQAEDITDAATSMQRAGISQERSGNVVELMSKAKSGEGLTPEEKGIVMDFVKDAKRFVKKEKPAAEVEEIKLPKELVNKKTKERVISFIDKQEAAARERMSARRNRFNSTPFDEWADMAIIGASKLAKGAIKFSDFSASMVREFGDSIKPQMRRLYTSAGESLRASSNKVSSTEVSQAEKVAEGFLRSNEARLTQDDIKLVRNVALKVSELSGREGQVASQELHAILNGFERPGILRKVSAAQYVAMLLNPLTQIRNVAGNELMYRLERLGRIVATPIDIAASKFNMIDPATGNKVARGRTITFKSGPGVWDDYFTPASDYWKNLGQGFKAGWRGVSPEGLGSKYEIGGQAFRSKYNPLTYMEKALGATMKGFDHAAYTRTVNQQMREMAYLDALNKGVKGKEAQRDHIADYMANIDGRVKEIADKYGKYVTLQDESLPAKGISMIRKGLNFGQDFGAGSVVLPFAKTPGNLLARTLDYSPVGILKAASQTYKIISDPKTDLTRADVIASVSRSLLGGGIGALGLYLADMGVLQGKSSDDAEVRKLMAQGGVKDFQINGTALKRVLSAMVTGGDAKEAGKMQAGDTLWAYQWASPTSAPLAIGNTIYQGTKDTKGVLATGSKAALTGLETLLDSSVLSGLQEAFATNYGQANPFIGVIQNLAKQLPGMFLPASVRQFNTIMDERTKETYSPDAWRNYINATYQNVPNNDLPQRVDTLGHPMTKANSFFDVFVSPAARSQYEPTQEAQFIIDLLNETGDQTVAPRAVAKYIKGKDSLGTSTKVDLSTKQYVQLQTMVGQKTAELINKINPTLPTDTKVAAVLKALTAAGTYGRLEMKKELGLK